MASTYEELFAENQALRDLCQQQQQVIDELRKTIDSLRRDIEDLKDKLALSSKNSSKPPSSDFKRNLHPKPPGPRKGRKGFFRSRYPEERVDQRVVSELQQCPHCQSDQLRERAKPAVHQQVELPEAKAIVTQYEMRRYRCRCCKRKISASLPQGITYSAFGPRLTATVGLLTGAYHLSKGETARLFSELYDIEISKGAISGLEKQVSKSLRHPYEEIEGQARASPLVKHLDETPWRDKGRTHYAWLLSTKLESLYRIFPGRHYAHAGELVGEDFSSPIVSDRYGAYLRLNQSQHQFCLAHLLREAQRISEHPRNRIGSELHRLLYEVLHLSSQYRSGDLSHASWHRRICLRRSHLDTCLELGRRSGLSSERRFCRSLWERFDWLWVFLRVPGMDPTNNLAERDLRPLVLWRKKSFGTQSDRGERYVERMMSVVSTLRKRGGDLYSYLQSCVAASRKGLQPPTVPTS